MYFLSPELYFPPVRSASPEGIVAIGGDLSPERLLLAYRSGIFPWFEDDEPILWWSPPERMVLFLDELKISKSMRNIINRGLFKVTFNTCFRDVISNCRDIKRDGQQGTWITDDMTEAYCQMHELGYAKSIEVWQDNELVGGLYGMDMGQIFCGESMFSKVPNASKVAFIALV
ncbi:MAG: leucyl/phenylalanyl-tRNA--protein transferase, partial [Flavobacterium sp.]